MSDYTFRRSNQFESYIGQFMRVFSGFYVCDGVARNGVDPVPKKVPVVYGNMSRITASILTNRETFTNNKLPIMGVNLVSITKDENDVRPPFHVDSIAARYADTGNTQAIERIHGPSFILGLEVSIYASSMVEMCELLEQILLIFNPRVTIRKTSDGYSSETTVDIALTGINNEIAYPIGTDQQVVVMTLTFDMPVRLSYPKGFKNSVINEIEIRMKNEDTDEIINTEIISEDDV